MRKLITLVVAAVAFFGMGAYRGRWQPVSSPEGHFRIDMKGVPDAKVDKQAVFGVGTLELRQWNSEPLLGRTAFTVTFLEFPQLPPGAPPLNLAGALANVRKGIVERSGGSVVEERDAELAGQNVTETEVDIPKPKMRLRLRAMIQGLRLYVLGFAYRGDREPPGEADRFFNSFQIND